MTSLGNRLGVAERHQHAAPVGQQLGRVPVGSRDHGFARAKRVGQRARGDLRFVEIRRDVQVRRADELLELIEFHEPVVEDDVLLDFVPLGEAFESQTIGFALLAQLVRVRGARGRGTPRRETPPGSAAAR